MMHYNQFLQFTKNFQKNCRQEIQQKQLLKNKQKFIQINLLILIPKIAVLLNKKYFYGAVVGGFDYVC